MTEKSRVVSLAHPLRKNDHGIEITPEMVTERIIWVDIHVEIEMRNSWKLKKISEDNKVESAKLSVRVRFQFRELIVQLKKDVCVNHTDFVNNKVLSLGPFSRSDRIDL